MLPKFQISKATQTAAYFTKLYGGRVYYLALVKLMYYADRQSFQELGYPITFDEYFSLPKGPILSNTFDLIRGKLGGQDTVVWYDSFTKDCNELILVKDPGVSQLSEAEIEIINKVFENHKTEDRWTLVEKTHDLPEYKKPIGKSRIPITYEDILSAVGFSQEEINETLKEYEYYTEIGIL